MTKVDLAGGGCWGSAISKNGNWGDPQIHNVTEAPVQERRREEGKERLFVFVFVFHFLFFSIFKNFLDLQITQGHTYAGCDPCELGREVVLVCKQDEVCSWDGRGLVVEVKLPLRD